MNSEDGTTGGAGPPAVLLALLALAAPALPPASAGLLEDTGDEVEVTLVQLPVMVTDGQGRAIPGLGKDDFELSEEGEPVPLAGFAGFGQAASPGVEPPPANLVIFLDRTYLEPGDLAEVPAALASFAGSLGPAVRVMLVSAEEGILHGFDSPREDLDGRLAQLPESAGRSRLASEHAEILAQIRRRVQEGADPRFQGSAGVQPQLLLLQVNAFADRAWRQLETTAARLHRLIEAVAGLPGRRDVLYVGGRLPASAGQSLYDAWRRAFGRTSSYWISAEGPEGPTADTDPANSGGLNLEQLPENPELLDTRALLEGVAEHATATGVTFHALDAGGPGGARGRVEASGASRPGDTRALRTLAQDTGGRSLARTGDLEADLAALGRELTSYYLLVFEPPRGADGELHRIRVRLPGRRGLKALHRPTFRARSRDQDTAARAVSSLLLGVTDNPLGVEVAAAGDEAGEGSVLRLVVRVPLDGLALVAEGRAHRGRLSVFTAFGVPGGGASPVTKAVVPVHLANDEILAAQGRMVEYVAEVTHPGPGGRAVVAVRDDLQTALSLVTFTVGAPEAVAAPEGASSRRPDRGPRPPGAVPRGPRGSEG